MPFCRRWVLYTIESLSNMFKYNSAQENFHLKSSNRMEFCYQWRTFKIKSNFTFYSQRHYLPERNCMWPIDLSHSRQISFELRVLVQLPVIVHLMQRDGVKWLRGEDKQKNQIQSSSWTGHPVGSAMVIFCLHWKL